MNVATVPAALGAMYFGTRIDEATSFALLDRFVERGGTLIDTADCYAFWLHPDGHGRTSEEVLGRWLAARPDVAGSVRIGTKVGAEPEDGESEGLAPETIDRAFRGSLERLGVDAVDLLWAHIEDRSVSTADLADGLAAQVEAGRATRIGLSNHPTWRTEQVRAHARAAGRPAVTALQLAASLVEPRPGAPVPGKDHRFGWVTDETLDYVESNDDVELWVYSPLMEGAYTRPDRPMAEAYHHPGTTRRLAAVDAICAETGATRNQIVLAWFVGGTVPAIPILGVSGVDQLDEALDGVALTLSTAQRRSLDDAV